MDARSTVRRGGLVSTLAAWSIASVTILTATGDMRLVDAARWQDAAAVRSLLAQGVDVNEPQGDGATPLHWAAYWGELDTVGLLVRSGADANATDDLGVTPLALACGNGDAGMVEALLNAGADPSTTAPSRPPALMLCARTGNLQAVRQLLARGADVNATEPSRSQTALMWAVAQRHPDVVRELTARGADVHARTQVTSRFVNIADPNDDLTIVAGTVPHGGSTPLLFAARQGALASARLLIAAGADVNDTAADGTSVIVTAAHSGHGTLARFLVEAGADPDHDAAGYTALHAAVVRGEHALVDVLVAHGADMNTRVTRGTPVTRGGRDFVLPHNLIGATPFLLASKFLELDVVRALAARRADPDISLADGTTPLMVAAGLLSEPGLFDRRGRITVPRPVTEERARQLVELLRNGGASVTAANQQGDTALHGAAIHGYLGVVDVLVKWGARLDAANRDGHTPLDVAVGSEMVTLLRALGAARQAGR
jgi:ankyrin repeat protein